MSNSRLNVWFFFLLLLSAFSFAAFNGRLHLFDWDEINFAESAREMIVTGDYMTVRIDYLPFWEKPPLFIWMQAFSMKVFGVNEFAARFPNTIAGILSLAVLFLAGKRFFDRRFGMIWCLTYVVSFLPFLYFKSSLIDPWFNLFIFSGILCFICYIENRSKRILLISSAVLIGLAVLTKGPAALLISLLTAGIFFLLVRFRGFIRLKDILIWCGIFVITGGFWFILMILQGKFDTIVDFIVYQARLFSTEDAGHGGFPLYHVVVLLIGVFPASIIAIPGFFKNRTTEESQHNFRKWMLILFWVVLILFSIVKTKIVHYSSLCYFPLTFMAALEIHYLFDHKKLFSRGLRIILLMMMGIWGLFSLAAPLAMGPGKDHLLTLLAKSDAATLSMLGADVTWPWYTMIPGVILILTMGLFIFYRRHLRNQLIVLAAGSFLFINTGIWFFTPRVEGYSQWANIEFFESLQGKDVYFRTLGIKSYAPYFYARKEQPSGPREYSKTWQFYGNIDKPVYCSFSLNKKDAYLKKYFNLKVLYEKNGFVFCVRNPNIPSQP